ncbi:MAG: phage tail protein [Halarcobacter sp.]
MADAYIGEIRLFAGNYAPRDWALCNGSLVAVVYNESLFSLLGTAYGGDGVNNFALPDFRGRVPMHFGTGVGLTPRTIGRKFGYEIVTLSIDEMPQHNHNLMAQPVDAHLNDPQDAFIAKSSSDFYDDNAEKNPPVTLSDDALMNSGHNEAHSNIQPCLGLSFIICLSGEYPSRN